MKISKKILAIALAVIMIISVLPFSAFAASSGTFDTGLSWNIDDNGKLTFSGSGAIPEAAFRFNYNYTEVVIDSCVTAIGEEAFRSSSVEKVTVSANFASAPYAFVTDSLTSVTFEEGVTTIPSDMFVHCYYDPGFELNLPSTLERIESEAFYNCKITSVTIPEGTALQEDSFVLEEESAIYNMVIEGNRRTFAVGQFDKLESNSNVQIYEGCKVVGTIPGEVTVNVAEGCSQAQVAESYKELFIEKVNEYLSWYDDIERVIERAFEDTKTQSWDDADDTGDFDKMIQGDAYADYYTVSVGEAKEIDAEITAENANLVFNNANVTIIPAANNAAEVNGVGYATLEEAIGAANAGDTVTLLQDVDFTVYPAFTRHTLDLTGVTLDLDSHTITGYNHSVVYVGDNFTIKNGNMVCVYDSVNNKKESYAAVIYPQVGNWQTDVVTDKSTGVVLENLVLTGGINCFGADVTVRGENTNVTGNYYYALWADVLATLTVEDGTFTSAASSTNGIIGACSDAGKEAYVDISGGDYTVPAGKNLVLQSTMASSQQLVEISGGTYNVVVPAKACAEGFVPVTEPNAQGKYTVAVVQYGTIEQMTGATITGNGTSHEKISIENTTMSYAEPDYSVGRYYAGYYLSGVKFVAPEGTVISENARYTNGSVDAQTGQLKVKNLYNAKDGANYMYSWPHVTEESLKEAIAAGVNKTWTYTFDWDGDGYFEQEAIIEIVCDTVTLVKDGEQVYPVVANNGSSLTLNDGVSLNVYLDADAYSLDANQAVVKLTYNHNADVSKEQDIQTDVIPLSEATKYIKEGDPYSGTYKFSFKMAPAQFADDITIELYASAEAAEAAFSATTNVKAKCDQVINLAQTNDAYASYATLCGALEDYCVASQVYFGYDAPATPAYNNAAVTTMDASDMEVPSASVGISAAGFSFTVVSGLEVNVFYTGDLEVTGVSIVSTKGANSVKAATTVKGDKSCINIKGIASGNMDNLVTVTTTAGDVTLAATNIAKAIAASSNNINYVNLARALYLYSVQASSYFGC